MGMAIVLIVRLRRFHEWRDFDQRDRGLPGGDQPRGADETSTHRRGVPPTRRAAVSLGPRTASAVNPAPGETNPFAGPRCPHQHARRRPLAPSGVAGAKPGAPETGVLGPATEEAAATAGDGPPSTGPPQTMRAGGPAPPPAPSKPAAGESRRERRRRGDPGAATLPAGRRPAERGWRLSPRRSPGRPGSGAAYPRAAPDGVSPGRCARDRAGDGGAPRGRR